MILKANVKLMVKQTYKNIFEESLLVSNQTRIKVHFATFKSEVIRNDQSD